MPEVVISYARSDAKEFAVRLVAELRGHGVDVWLDTSNIQGGMHWLKELETAINSCNFFIALRTPNAKRSIWVRSERLLALNRNERKPTIIPALLADCEDDLELISFQQIDFRGDFYAPFANLLAVINGPTQSTFSETVDQRTLEIAYLGKLLLEFSVWKEVYTPLAGNADILRDANPRPRPQIKTTATEMEIRFRRRLSVAPIEPPSKAGSNDQRSNYQNILAVVRDAKQFVLLGDPGAGKTTTLWHMLIENVQAALTDPNAPVPILVHLGNWDIGYALDDLIQLQLKNLSPFFSRLDFANRLIYYFDGLNEIPQPSRNNENLKALKKLLVACRENGTVFVATCRELDYTGVLDLEHLDKVSILPLDPPRIYRFIQQYVLEPVGAAEELFWDLAGDFALSNWERFKDQIAEAMDVFWLSTVPPDNLKDAADWQWWCANRDNPRSLLALATNPFMLWLIIQVYGEYSRVPENRGKLFQEFVDSLFDRENLTPQKRQELHEALANLGYKMQQKGQGTAFHIRDTEYHLGGKDNIYYALSANILSGSETLRFSHQLLQEFFAAKRLELEIKSGIEAAQLFPPSYWWLPTGWEETALLLAGLQGDDLTSFIHWLVDAQPELAARCIVESGAYTPDEAMEFIAGRLRNRLIKPSAHAEARAAIGRALGMLGLDLRAGVTVTDLNLPDIEWCEIPPGEFLMGGDPRVLDAFCPQEGKQIEIDYRYWMSKYPITYAQFNIFADHGYANESYWTNGGLRWRKGRTRPSFWHDRYWNISNHPVIGITWYEAVAFTNWLNERLNAYSSIPFDENCCIRLPTEAEWEKAARGYEGHFFSYGNDLDFAKANHHSRVRSTSSEGTSGSFFLMEREERLREVHFMNRTTAVGLYYNDKSSYGVYDLSGNVWEWCISQWNIQYVYPEDTSTEGKGKRVLKGGAWNFSSDAARLASRGRGSSDTQSDLIGFRVCIGPKLT